MLTVVTVTEKMIQNKQKKTPPIAGEHFFYLNQLQYTRAFPCAFRRRGVSRLNR